MSAEFYYHQKLNLEEDGSILLPNRVKEILNIMPGDYLEMYLKDDGIVIQAKKKGKRFYFSEGFELIAK